MAYRVTATETFVEEYEAIVDDLLVEGGSPKTASRFIEEMDVAVGRISLFPESNAVSAKEILLDFGLREQLVFGYVIVYAIEHDAVVLMHIFHQRQDFEKDI